MIYLDCFRGVSGGTLASALFDLKGDASRLVSELSGLGFEGLEVSGEKRLRGGISGTRLSFRYSSAPETGRLGQIRDLLSVSPAGEELKKKLLEFYCIIFEAEALVHGREPEEVHLHEIGSPDTMLEAASVILLVSGEKVFSSPLPLGTGVVSCQHGEMPLPSPAAAGILEGIPVRKTEVPMELVTPTGAALVKLLAGFKAGDFVIKKTGYGIGERSVLRVFLADRGDSGEVIQAETEIDDMTPEDAAILSERLREDSLDVTVIPLLMKKSRPGFLIRALVCREKFDKFRETLYRHSSTAGFRYRTCMRDILERETFEYESSLGSCRVKKLFLPGGGVRMKPESGDLERIASGKGISVSEARRVIEGELGL